MRELLRQNNQWIWTGSQQEAFDLLKDALSSTPVLALYDPNKATTVSADASQYGLGAVLTQKQENGQYRPVMHHGP